MQTSGLTFACLSLNFTALRRSGKHPRFGFLSAFEPPRLDAGVCCQQPIKARISIPLNVLNL